NQIEGLLQPWTCPGCQNLNPVSEMRCLRCQTARPIPVRGEPALSTPNVPDHGSAREPPPKPVRRSSEKKARAADYWQQAGGTDRCRECGVKYSYGDLRCRACGNLLGGS